MTNRVTRAGSRRLEGRTRGRSRRWLTRLAAVFVAAGMIVVPSAAPAFASQPAAASHLAHPRSYYVSLGDSLSFGYQPNLVASGDTNPADYRSYAEDYAAFRPSLSLINYGCPGETTTTFISGGCPWPGPLHDSYGASTSQFAATEAFLANHRGQVSLVSLDIGNNDLLALVKSCEASDPSDPEPCLAGGLPGVVGTMTKNIGTMLAMIHRLAPDARVVLFNLYNPLALTMPASDQLIAGVNRALAQVAAGYGARVADAFGVINIKAGSTVEKWSVCLLTWECTKYQNVHPTTLGYYALAVALARAAH